MYGLEAISIHNGWAMAGVGAVTVFIGLTVLATVISQLHKILDFFTANAARIQRPQAPAAPESNTETAASVAAEMPSDVAQVAVMYQNASQSLGGRFELKDLHRIAREMNFPHPHITISALRREGKLGAEEDGLFFWNL